MRVSLFLPTATILEEGQNAGPALQSIARTAEAVGFDACNLTDHPAPTAAWRRSHGHDAFDPFTGLGYIAAATSRLRLHTHILVLPYRNPLLTAKCAASLDFLSGGRLTLGIGSGYMEGEYDALGVDFAARGKIMDESLDVLKLAWSEEEVVYEGSNFRAVGNLPRPLPLQKPHPPIWGGGNSAPAIRRAAEKCDGWSPFFTPGGRAQNARTDDLSSVDGLRGKIAILREHLARLGKDRFDICVALPVFASKRTRDEAQRLVDVAGELSDAGITWTLGNMPHKGCADLIEAIGWYGAEVLPKIHAM